MTSDQPEERSERKLRLGKGGGCPTTSVEWRTTVKKWREKINLVRLQVRGQGNMRPEDPTMTKTQGISDDDSNTTTVTGPQHEEHKTVTRLSRTQLR